jgi:hypothetical protein
MFTAAIKTALFITPPEAVEAISNDDHTNCSEAELNPLSENI